MLGIGEELKNTRKEKQLSLKEVEENTKIRKKYLKSIEEEKFEEIYGDVYVKGFIKNYGDYLNLDGDRLVKEYEEMIQDQEKLLEEIEKKGKKNRKFSISVEIILIVILVVLLLFLVVYNI